jgi:hypothetical protein
MCLSKHFCYIHIIKVMKDVILIIRDHQIIVCSLLLNRYPINRRIISPTVIALPKMMLMKAKSIKFADINYGDGIDPCFY